MKTEPYLVFLPGFLVCGWITFDEGNSYLRKIRVDVDDVVVLLEFAITFVRVTLI